MYQEKTTHYTQFLNLTTMHKSFSTVMLVLRIIVSTG